MDWEVTGSCREFAPSGPRFAFAEAWCVQSEEAGGDRHSRKPEGCGSKDCCLPGYCAVISLERLYTRGVQCVWGAITRQVRLGFRDGCCQGAMPGGVVAMENDNDEEVVMAGPKYYPILKWKAGEQGVVRNLAQADKALILPVLEIQPAPRGKSLIQAVVDSLNKSQATGLPIGLDPALALSTVTFSAVRGLCAAAARFGFQTYPVVRARELFAGLNTVGQLGGAAGIVLRLQLDVISLAGVLGAVASVRKAIGRGAPLHVIYDFGSIGDIDPSTLLSIVEPFARETLAQGCATQVAMAGGSFPMSLAGFPIGNNFLPRREWLVWEMLRKQRGCEDVRFGDYNVTNPVPMDQIDPRTINPAAAIRYALDGEWWLLRARGSKTSGFGQYNTLCRLLTRDPRYAGQQFSFGDQRYHFHAQPGASPGNYMTWRRDAASHHLVQTVRKLDSLI